MSTAFTSLAAFVFMALYSTDVTLSNSLTAYPSAPYSFLVFSLICALVAYNGLDDKDYSMTKSQTAKSFKSETLACYGQLVLGDNTFGHLLSC